MRQEFMPLLFLQVWGAIIARVRRGGAETWLCLKRITWQQIHERLFVCEIQFKRGEFWTPPRRGSIVWSSGARFPFGPAAVFWGVLRLLSACAGYKPAEERQDVDIGVEYRRIQLCVWRRQLTWQALRLSLISTWLVWEPTHMYTWRKEQFVCDHVNTNTPPRTLSLGLPLCHCPATWCHRRPNRPDRNLSTSPKQRNNLSRWNIWGTKKPRIIICNVLSPIFTFTCEEIFNHLKSRECFI